MLTLNMATYAIPERLNALVEVYGLHTTILSWVTVAGRMTHQQVYDNIQSDDGLDAYVKGHTEQEIKTVMDWMVNQGLLVNANADQKITYTLQGV